MKGDCLRRANLVPRVPGLLGQRAVATRDSGGNGITAEIPRLLFLGFVTVYS